MSAAKTIFSQLMDFLPTYEFRKCVDRYNGNYKVKSFSCWDQFLSMAFAQLTFRESLRDIQACLARGTTQALSHGLSRKSFTQHPGQRQQMRDWRIYADFAHVLIAYGQVLLRETRASAWIIDQTVYALDSTIIDLCLSLFPWAKFRKRKGAVKLHTLLDLRGSYPNTHLHHPWEDPRRQHSRRSPCGAGAIYVMDRGYLDFARLHRMHQSMGFFITRTKSNFRFRRLYSHPVDRTTGLQCDQTIVLKVSTAEEITPRN